MATTAEAKTTTTTTTMTNKEIEKIVLNLMKKQKLSLKNIDPKELEEILSIVKTEITKHMGTAFNQNKGAIEEAFEKIDEIKEEAKTSSAIRNLLVGGAVISGLGYVGYKMISKKDDADLGVSSLFMGII